MVRFFKQQVQRTNNNGPTGEGKTHARKWKKNSLLTQHSKYCRRSVVLISTRDSSDLVGWGNQKRRKKAKLTTDKTDNGQKNFRAYRFPPTTSRTIVFQTAAVRH
jgi:hypothetical protein